MVRMKQSGTCLVLLDDIVDVVHRRLYVVTVCSRSYCACVRHHPWVRTSCSSIILLLFMFLSILCHFS